jgi:ubiquinone/menaquinone biosynthesis C-methylase UbiE
MSTEEKVSGHYGKAGLEERILNAVGKLGKDPATLRPSDLAAMDEFHVGGVASTQALAEQMELRPGLRLLDVGCGVGGPARYFAAEHVCRVLGVDLTDEFVKVADSLTKMLKLEHLAEFRQGSALALPSDIETFDRAYMIHVGMNIADKAGVFREVKRVLKAGGLFAIFDVMRTTDGELRYPVPWAVSGETSFVEEPAAYRKALEDAGFKVERERQRGDFAIQVTERSMQDMAKNGPPVLGLQLLMGEKTPVMVANILGMMKEGLIEPVELVARA